jgi:hypothetical protein
MADVAYTINDFISAFPKAGARPNLFAVSIEGKGQTYFKNVPTFKDEHFLLCQGASLPASDLSAIPVSFMGRTVKLPGTRTFADLSLTFYNDEDMSMRIGFEEWTHDIQKFANVFGNKVEINNDSDIISTVFVTQLGKKGNQLRRYKFVTAFPTQVSDIALSYGDSDTIESFTVTMAYQYYEIEEAATRKLKDE